MKLTGAHMPNEAEPPDFLVHRAGESVAVAIRDLSPGIVRGGYLSRRAP
jgi:hypothetical protein